MLAYLQLIRLPTVFTAMADIVLGYVLTHRVIVGPEGWDDPAKFFGLLASSCCLYLAGMVFNDVFDRKQDAEERPSRPIPSRRWARRQRTSAGPSARTRTTTASPAARGPTPNASSRASSGRTFRRSRGRRSGSTSRRQAP